MREGGLDAPVRHPLAWRAGESQANRRYLYFAQKADIEGYNDVGVFRAPVKKFSRMILMC